MLYPGFPARAAALPPAPPQPVTPPTMLEKVWPEKCELDGFAPPIVGCSTWPELELEMGRGCNKRIMDKWTNG
jgi:hypothetical protein